MKVLEKNKHVYGRFPPDEDYRTVKLKFKIKIKIKI